ncbi:MAG: pilus assembly protein PilM [bacterium]|nr:pilus assembly protein PilM [bacterium]
MTPLEILAQRSTKIYKEFFLPYTTSLRNKSLTRFTLTPLFLGLDIGFFSIKIAQFRGSRLTGAAYKEIPQEIRANKEEVSRFIIQTLPSMLKDGKFEGKNVNFFVNGPQQINVSSFTLPSTLSGKDLEGAIVMRLKKETSFDFKTSFYDFSSTPLPGSNECRIIGVVSPQEVIEEKVDTLQKAKLIPVSCNTVGYLLQNLLKISKIMDEKEVAVFMNVGGRVTTMNFFKGNKFQLTREVYMGGDDITKSLLRPIITKEGKKTLSYTQAEAIKKDYGIIGEEDKKEIEGDIPFSQISAMMRPFSERFLREVNRSFTFYERESNTKVDRIYLCGGGSNLKGLDEFLSKSLNSEIIHFNPLKNLSLELPPEQKKNLEKIGPDLIFALGAALDKEKEINLLPPQLKLTYKLSSIKTGITIAIISFALALFSLYGLVSAKIKQQHELIKNSKAYLAPVEEKLGALDELQNWQKKVDMMKNVFLKAGKQPIWEGVLKEVSRLIPEGIVLSSISLDTSSKEVMKLFMKGSIVSSASIEQFPLAEFLIQLRTSPFFSQVEMLSFLKNMETGKADFELNCKIVY